MVRRQACFHRQRGPIHLCLRRAPRHPRSLLQFESRQRERVQILLVRDESKMERKITSQRPTETGLSAHLQFYYYQPELGPEFIKRALGAMDATFGDRRAITDWLAAGKFAICHGCRQIEKASGQGLPVEDFETGDWKEGQPLSTGGGSISLIKGAPHPNAARVFINWFLS